MLLISEGKEPSRELVQAANFQSGVYIHHGLFDSMGMREAKEAW